MIMTHNEDIQKKVVQMSKKYIILLITVKI
jgi:hypothetical protein